MDSGPRGGLTSDVHLLAQADTAASWRTAPLRRGLFRCRFGRLDDWKLDPSIVETPEEDPRSLAAVDSGVRKNFCGSQRLEIGRVTAQQPLAVTDDPQTILQTNDEILDGHG